MVDYREIIRLKSLNHSNTSVAASTGSSRNTVSDVWHRAEKVHLVWSIPDNLNNRDLQAILYPDRKSPEGRQLPDYEYVMFTMN